MTPAFLLRAAIDPALSLLPPAMTSPAARTLLLAICVQESNLEHRAQVKGPARGYPQFELGLLDPLGGLTALVHHRATRDLVGAFARALDYAAPRLGERPVELHAALTHNDVLAMGLARLNLYWHPWPIPTTRERAQDMYVQCWRPGKFHPERWPRSWAIAVEATG